jgi:SAM-dependent MidA family methyltransferase
MTVAAFMDLALYDPAFGYYARGVRRSGRAGDFFTSVDVGRLFGELLETQIAEMADILRPQSRNVHVDLVEAGAGNGRLAADILRAACERHPDLYRRLRVHLVETSATARNGQSAVLGAYAERLASSSADLPASFEGVLVANELLDAIPTHQVVMRGDGLHEVYVISRDGTLTLADGPLSTPALAEYLKAVDAALEPGWRAEINLRAVTWVRDAVRRLTRGFLVFFDYGHEARDLFSVSHAAGTLTTFSRHTTEGPADRAPAWLRRAGEQDITAHVDFTSVRRAAEEEGAATLGFLDQTYFLLSLFEKEGRESLPSIEKDSRALKTLVMPGGLGSTMKVLVLGKGVGTPALAGCSGRTRVT